MLPPSPSGEELAQLRALHAHRYPQSATLRPPGAEPITLLLGLPSGACRMPPGAYVAPVWLDLVRASLRSRHTRVDDAALAADCVLWPAPGAWAQIVEEWPAIVGAVVRLVLQKVGKDTVRTPTPLDSPPEQIAAALTSPRMIWRRVVCGSSDAYAAAIAPPSAGMWAVFTDEAGKDDADHWRIMRDLVAGCVPAFTRADGGAAMLEVVGARWPGVVISLWAEIAVMAGAAAEAELGE